MNILAVGDLNGRINCLEAAISKFRKGRYDVIVFMGNYTDSYIVPIHQQLECLKAIAEYQYELGPDVLIPLIGAKDHPAYVHKFWVTGSRKEMAASYAKNYEFSKYRIAWQCGNYLFTHSGINQKWWTHMRHLRWFVDHIFHEEIQDEADLLNKMYDLGMYRYLFDAGRVRKGRMESGGPLWSDEYENENYRWLTCDQVVGHTYVNEIKMSDKQGSRIYYTNCLSMNPDMFLELSVDE